MLLLSVYDVRATIKVHCLQLRYGFFGVIEFFLYGSNSLLDCISCYLVIFLVNIRPLCGNRVLVDFAVKFDNHGRDLVNAHSYILPKYLEVVLVVLSK